MNEWQTISWVAGISSVIFGSIWIIVQTAKNEVMGRVKNVEHIVDNMISDCARKKEDFITTKGFDRFEGHIVNRMDGFNKSIENLTKRVDDLVLALRHENGKSIH